MRLRTLAGNERGDTIIEVLISMAVAASVLGVTYAIMNKNLLISRANQERTEGSKLVVGQLESMKNLTLNGRTTLEDLKADGVQTFCIDTAESVPEDSVITLSPLTANADGTATFGGASPSYCEDGIYRYAIDRDDTDEHLYRIYVVWDSVVEGQDRITMNYRL